MLVATLSIVAGIAGVLVAGLLGVAVWARRAEGKPDVPGVRTIAAFEGGAHFISAEERRDEQDQGAAALGGGLLAALALELKKHGLEVDEPDRDDYGWGVTVRRGAEKAYVLLGAAEESEWSLAVLDPSSGGPGPRGILPFVDISLKALPGLSGIAWHRRDRFSAGDLSSASQSPVS